MTRIAQWKVPATIVVLLAFSFMAAAFLPAVAGAAEWETWPPRKPGAEGAPPSTPAAEAGAQAGATVSSGVSAGTIAKWSLVGAAVIGVGIAIGSGGGDSSTNH